MHIYNENKSERVLMTRSFLSHLYKTRVFTTWSFILYNNGRFYIMCCLFPLFPNQ